MAALGMWTTPSDLMRLARAVNARAAPEMLVGHAVEPRMGLGLFLNEETGHKWWSHSGSVAGFECLHGRRGRSRFRLGRPGELIRAAPLVKTVGDLVSRSEGPSPFAMHDLLWEGISAAIRMNEHHLTAAGTYRLDSGLDVVLGDAARSMGPVLDRDHAPRPADRPTGASLRRRPLARSWLRGRY